MTLDQQIWDGIADGSLTSLSLSCTHLCVLGVGGPLPCSSSQLEPRPKLEAERVVHLGVQNEVLSPAHSQEGV